MDENVRRAASAQPAPAQPSAANATVTANTNAPRVQQPKPQALPSRSGPSSILVAPRQKGNPILNSVRNVAWEYSDIPCDYVLGATTCALFLSLKYHRLHPEYIFNRIRDLRGQYNLRVLLVMVDIENHEDSLRDLSKTSLINNVTIILAWSAQEAGRYLELFKTFEHTAPTSIRAQQATSYSDKLVEFITVPRSINKTDAVGLVSNFGSVRTAVNAGPEEIGMIAGWGEKKVQRWCNSVREPFRVKKTAKRGISRDDSRATMSRELTRAEGENSPAGIRDPLSVAVDLAQDGAATSNQADADKRPPERLAEEVSGRAPSADEEEALRAAELGPVQKQTQPSLSSSGAAKRKAADEDVSEGIMAALNKLRKP